jgi:transcriptional regulator with XRE-family HTH domain
MARQHEVWPKEGTPEWKLLKYAQKQGWADMQLGEISGASKTAISYYRSGKQKITWEMAMRIAKKLGINLIHLMDPDVHEIPMVEGQAVTLGEEEAEVLRLARRIGMKRAIDRILVLPDEATQEEESRVVRSARLTPPSVDDPKRDDNPARKLPR